MTGLVSTICVGTPVAVLGYIITNYIQKSCDIHVGDIVSFTQKASYYHGFGGEVVDIVGDSVLVKVDQDKAPVSFYIDEVELVYDI